MVDQREVEIRQNYDFFKGIVASMMDEHAGKVALIHERTIVDLFATHGEAVSEGVRRFGDLPFSVQRVVNRPIDLGFLSHAGNNGIAV